MIRCGSVSLGWAGSRILFKRCLLALLHLDSGQQAHLEPKHHIFCQSQSTLAHLNTEPQDSHLVQAGHGNGS